MFERGQGCKCPSDVTGFLGRDEQGIDGTWGIVALKEVKTVVCGLPGMKLGTRHVGPIRVSEDCVVEAETVNKPEGCDSICVCVDAN